jgi:hypothetical protein
MITRNLLTSILDLTRRGECSLEDLSKHARLPLAEARTQANKLSDSGELVLKGNVLSASSKQRLRLALKALSHGADLERICRLLSWQEFEDITVKSLEANGFLTFKHLAFRSGNNRREIDVVGVGYMLVICADCKHWMKALRGSTVELIARKQVERVTELASNRDARRRLGVPERDTVSFVPAVVSLLDAEPRLVGGVPIVSVLKLNSFLSSIDPFVEGILMVKAKGATWRE